MTESVNFNKINIATTNLSNIDTTTKVDKSVDIILGQKTDQKSNEAKKDPITNIDNYIAKLLDKKIINSSIANKYYAKLNKIVEGVQNNISNSPEFYEKIKNDCNSIKEELSLELANNILKEDFGININKMPPNTELSKLGYEELDMVKTVLKYEREWECPIDYEELKQSKTINDFVKFLNNTFSKID